MERLPSYDDLPSFTEPPLLDNPPTYAEARESSKAREMPDLPSLILVDGRLIYDECQSQLPLYSLSQSAEIRSGKATSRITHEITKHIYRLSAHDGEGYVLPQSARLYDVAFEKDASYFNPGESALSLLGGGVDIVGDVNAPGGSIATLVFRNRGILQNLLLVGCEVVINRKDSPRKVLLQATQPLEVFISNSYDIEWRDGAGKLLAIETMPRRARPGAPSSPGDGCGEGWRGLPRLEVKAPMARRQFDFLVTCWMARFRKIESIYNA